MAKTSVVSLHSLGITSTHGETSSSQQAPTPALDGDGSGTSLHVHRPQDTAPVSYQPPSGTHSLGGGCFTPIPAPLGNGICCSWAITGHPQPPPALRAAGCSSQRRRQLLNLPMPPLNCTDGLVILDQSWRHTYVCWGFFQHQVQNTSPLSYFPPFGGRILQARSQETGLFLLAFCHFAA